MAYPFIIDVETQHTLQEVGFNHKKLKISVVGAYDYQSNQYQAYFEKDLSKLFIKLEHASCIIGFNINKFDLPVLSPYYLGNISQFHTFDILDEIEKKLGFRVALDDIARATLDIRKSGHGLLAIEYFKKGELEKLKKYCLDDVKITKEIYDYGKKYGRIYFIDSKGKREIMVSFTPKSANSGPVSLSLPL